VPEIEYAVEIWDLSGTDGRPKPGSCMDTDGNGSFETLVLTVNVTFSPPTSNGRVPESGFTFTSSSRERLPGELGAPTCP
jgi:hypothetical protein